MVKLTKKSSIAGLPITERATAYIISPDPKKKNFLYCGPKSVIIRDIENPGEYKVYSQHQKQPTCAKYAPSGNYICSGDAVGKVRVWDTINEENILKGEYQPLSGRIRDIAWTSDSQRIIVAGEGKDKFSHAFMMDGGSRVGEMVGMTKSCNSVAVRQERPFRAVVASEDFHAYFYSGPPFKQVTVEDLREEGGNFSNCVRYAPNNSVFAVANQDHHVYIRDGKTAAFIGELIDTKDEAHSGGVFGLDFSPDSKEILTVSADKTAKLWNVETRELITTFTMGSALEDQQLGCMWQGDNILTVSLSGEIKYLDRNNPSTPLKTITGHNKAIQACAVGKDGQLFTADYMGIVCRWDTATLEGKRFSGKGHGKKISAMAYDPATNQLITVGLDNNVMFTDCDSCDFATSTSIKLDTEPKTLAITAEGYILVGCDKNQLVLIKDGRKLDVSDKMTTEKPLVAAHSTNVMASGPADTSGGYMAEGQSCLHFSIEDDKLVLNQGEKDDKVAPVASKEVCSVAYSPDGSKLAMGDSKTVYIYNVVDGFNEPAVRLSGHTQSVKCMQWSPDNRHLCTGGVDQRIYVWDTESKKSATVVGAHPKSVITAVSWLDEHTVVSCGEDFCITQWTVQF